MPSYFRPSEYASVAVAVSPAGKVAIAHDSRDSHKRMITYAKVTAEQTLEIETQEELGDKYDVRTPQVEQGLLRWVNGKVQIVEPQSENLPAHKARLAGWPDEIIRKAAHPQSSMLQIQDSVKMEDGTTLYSLWAYFPSHPLLYHKTETGFEPVDVSYLTGHGFAGVLEKVGNRVMAHCTHMGSDAYTMDYVKGTWDNVREYPSTNLPMCLNEKGVWQLTLEGVRHTPLTPCKEYHGTAVDIDI